eukprot:c45152_g1_i1 orf=2-661(-)
MGTATRHAELKLVQLLQYEDSNSKPNTEEIWLGEKKLLNSSKHPDSDVSAASVCSAVEGSGFEQSEFDLCSKKPQNTWMEEHGHEEIIRLPQSCDRRRKLRKESSMYPFQMQQKSETAQISVSQHDCVPTRASSSQKLDNQIHWESRGNASRFKLHEQTVLPVDSKYLEGFPWLTVTKSPARKRSLSLHKTPDYESNAVGEDNPTSNKIGDGMLIEIYKV